VAPVSQAEGGETLGIIGGAGVAAAARLYSDVAEGFRALHGRLPAIALWNLPLSDDLEHAFVSGVGVAEATAEAERLVVEAVQRLLDARATVIAMPCNSLQRVAAREAERRGVPFVNMIDATLGPLRAASCDRAVLLATETTYATGIYDGYGVEFAPPEAALREELSGFIVRAVQEASASAPGELSEIIERAREPGVPVVIGCTDICGILAPEEGLVESLACLAASCVERLGPAEERAAQRPR
jgi:aspartate racemase